MTEDFNELPDKPFEEMTPAEQCVQYKYTITLLLAIIDQMEDSIVRNIDPFSEDLSLADRQLLNQAKTRKAEGINVMQAYIVPLGNAAQE